MASELELLDAAEHGALRLRKSGQEVPHFVQVVGAEFASAATRCPVLLTKNSETGQFYVGALYGFQPGENLLGGPNEPAPYRPLDLERQGFFIAGENIAIDRGNPRFDEQEGDALFEPDGSAGEKLRYVQRVLGRLKTGVEETDAFIRALLHHHLIEPIDISMRFDDGETLALQGLYTVSLDALHELDDMAVLALFRNGYLRLAYCMIDSLKQIQILAQKRNALFAFKSE
jgi:hypothetical protein